MKRQKHGLVPCEGFRNEDKYSVQKRESDTLILLVCLRIACFLEACVYDHQRRDAVAYFGDEMAQV